MRYEISETIQLLLPPGTNRNTDLLNTDQIAYDPSLATLFTIFFFDVPHKASVLKCVPTIYSDHI
jgi:hypothetical protein